MDDFRAALREFIRSLYRGPMPPDVPTVLVMRGLREYLDAVLPHWRALATGGLAGATSGVFVALPVRDGRVVHGPCTSARAR